MIGIVSKSYLHLPDIADEGNPITARTYDSVDREAKRSPTSDPTARR